MKLTNIGLNRRVYIGNKNNRQYGLVLAKTPVSLFVLWDGNCIADEYLFNSATKIKTV